MVNMNSKSALVPLIAGYRRFKEQYFANTNFFKELVEKGQRPKVMVIACCDSRVDPAIVTNCAPGKLFVVRNIANLIPPFASELGCNDSTSAALEFGVLHLGVSDIIVLGHSHCGGIRSLMERTDNDACHSTDFIDVWMRLAALAKQKVLADYSQHTFTEQMRLCEQESLLLGLKNLRTFPWIEARVAKDNLFLHAWYFNLDTGILETYDSVRAEFVPL